MTNDERYSFNSNDLIYKVFLYKKQLIITTVVGAIIAIIVSFLITPLYRSSVVIYPAPSLSISQELIATKDAAKKESMYGEDKETEQILQVLNSDELRTKIIQKYNLWKHYDIDSANVKYPNDKMMKKYQKRISYKRTEYMAVEISVLDANPDTAALIANDIATLIDTVMNQMEHKRAKEALQIVEYEYKAKEEQINMFKDSLRRIMEKGIYDYESQSEVVNEAYAQAVASGNTKGAERIKGYAVNLLDEHSTFPKSERALDAIWMSQFLDCFSMPEIISILKRAKQAMTSETRIYIMETLWDRQRYETAAFCLTMTSLYFTALANGNSKMYNTEDMRYCIEQAGLQIEQIHDHLGLGHSILVVRSEE